MTVQPRARSLQYSVSADAWTFEGLKATEKKFDLARLKAVLNQNLFCCSSALVSPSDEPTLEDSRVVWSPLRQTHTAQYQSTSISFSKFSQLVRPIC